MARLRRLLKTSMFVNVARTVAAPPARGMRLIVTVAAPWVAKKYQKSAAYLREHNVAEPRAQLAVKQDLLPRDRTLSHPPHGAEVGAEWEVK